MVKRVALMGGKINSWRILVRRLIAEGRGGDGMKI
jgi:hypothetical protein